MEYGKIKTKHRGGRIVLFLVLCGFLSFVAVQQAHALRVSMKRIIFEGRDRSSTITIINNSAVEEIYRIGWNRYRMVEDKALVRVKDGDEEGAAGVLWAEDMIRYAPRRVKVAAGGTQQVRLLLRRPRDLAEGEYRAHIHIVTEEKAEEFVSDAVDQAALEGKQAVVMNMQPGISMPVIVRHGKMTATSEMSEPRLVLNKDDMSVSFKLHREGNRSLYGNVRFFCIGNGQDVYVRDIRGIAVYPEVSQRSVAYNIEYPKKGAEHCNKMRIEYVAERDDSLFKGALMSQIEVDAVR